MQKNRYLAAALAIILGTFGVHKLYLGKLKKGILYFVFSWTMIPTFLGFYSGVQYLLATDNDFQRKYVDEVDGNIPQESEEYVMRATGRNGQLTLFEDKVRISRQGIVSTITNPFKGDKDIRLDDITSIQFRKSGTMTTGYIQVGQSGYHESDDGVFDAATDENSVTFTQSDQDDFEKIRDEIEKRRGEDSSSERDSAIERLREKYAEGEISEEEFEERKSVLQNE